jgi:hypothetical protein
MNALEQFDAVLARPAPAPGNPLAEFDAVKAPEARKPAEKKPAETATPGGDAADQIIRTMVQNTGAGIIAGWRGMSTLATGGTLEDASANVNEELENRSYHPDSEKIARILASPYNPMNWVGMAGKKAGEISQDLGASPAVSAGVETGATALPLLLMRSGNVGEPIQPFRMFERAPVEGLASTVLPLEEQTRRAGLLARLGIDEARKSALTGNMKEAATDFQQSKLDNQAGNFMRAKLDAERAALTQHAENIVQNTGGTVGSDLATAYTRGETILKPLDNLSDYFNRQIKTLYQEADERAKGVNIDMPRLHEKIGGDQADFLATEEGTALLRGLTARMKSLGIKEGEGGGVTVEQAERLKQFMNNAWQPRTAKLINGLREAIDDDVTSSAGEDIYGQARALRRMRAVTLDEPNGIGKLLDASGPEGINRKVPIEQIPDRLAGMPVDQLAHVVRTLRTVPEELQPQAQAALSELRAHFANKVLDAGAGRVGQWGSRDVSRYIRNNQAKLEMVMSPEELSQLGDLEEGGRILRLDQTYPGQIVQAHNLIARGALAGIRAGGAVAGEVLGSAVGAPGLGSAVGAGAGAKLASRFEEGAALRAARGRFVRLSDVGK